MVGLQKIQRHSIAESENYYYTEINARMREFEAIRKWGVENKSKDSDIQLRHQNSAIIQFNNNLDRQMTLKRWFISVIANAHTITNIDQK